MAKLRNQIVVEGNLTREPFYGVNDKTGKAYVMFTIAENKSHYNENMGEWQTDWVLYHNVSAFGYEAQALVENGITKGDAVMVVGTLQPAKDWVDKEGKVHTGQTTIIATCVYQKLWRKKSGNPTPPSNQNYGGAGKMEQVTEPTEDEFTTPPPPEPDEGEVPELTQAPPF